MDEFEFIESIKPKTYKQSSVIKGIGDDAAVFRQTAKDIVTSVDTFVENIHFSPITMNPYYIGYRALAANLSDLAAMGAEPAFYLVSIVIPDKWSDSSIQEIFMGMKSLANMYKMDLIGGDTVSGEKLSISITVIGYVMKGHARYRSLSVNGDIVFVTGTLGDASAGLHIMTHEGSYIEEAYLKKRHQMPSPRVPFALQLEHINRVALNDISDGIANEASELAKDSNVDIHLIADNIPIHASLEQFTLMDQRKWKLFGGEDFELIGTVSSKDWPNVKEAAEKSDTKLTKVGYVTDPKSTEGKVFLHEEEKTSLLKKHGYTHLK
ncbi:thiamine-phosphate kinase [Oceanobacillus halotolerans]|uniref:thiamine-phosphate kinase n=1 Tax=Oceanobacillus halotolerans TaxID=2663380 RepID=UPI0013DD4F3A|nr:thiamine-phosphate kinase [Oceanobacillus halotolerans]